MGRGCIMEELKKMLDAVSLQLVLVIVIGVISIAIMNSIYAGITTFDQLIAASASPLSIASMILSIVSIVVIAWAGYVWAKESKGSAVDGGKAGALVSLISGIITGYLSMLYVYPILARLYSVAGIPGISASSFGVTTYIIGIISSLIIGFILGAIGGYFGKGKK
jgi:hypothetical protein